MQAQESKVVSDSNSSASKPQGSRLVIRVKITPEPPPPPPQNPISPRAVGISAAVVALLTLGWLGINASKDESVSPATSAAQDNSPSQSAPASLNSANSEQARAIDTAAADVSPIQPVGGATASTAPSEPAVPEPVNEVLPDTPRSALQTISGTVRVAIRVDIDQSGNVTATHSEIPGPSRYFERLSREAASKWTFTPTNSNESRAMLLRFYYKRDGVSAEATAPE